MFTFRPCLERLKRNRFRSRSKNNYVNCSRIVYEARKLLAIRKAHFAAIDRARMMAAAVFPVINSLHTCFT